MSVNSLSAIQAEWIISLSDSQRRSAAAHGAYCPELSNGEYPKDEKKKQHTC
jgi:hypothetical protein